MDAIGTGLNAHSAEADSIAFNFVQCGQAFSVKTQITSHCILEYNVIQQELIKRRGVRACNSVCALCRQNPWVVQKKTQAFLWFPVPVADK